MKKIFSIILILLTITVVALSFLGNIKREGSLEILIENTAFNYNAKMIYDTQIFRHSDIFLVFPIIDNLPKYIETIEFAKLGSGYADITTNEEIELGSKIDNINYTLKIKMTIYIYFFIFSVAYLLVFQFSKLLIIINSSSSIINSLSLKLNNKKLFKIICILVLLFSLFIRIYDVKATTYSGLHMDEFASIWMSNNNSKIFWEWWGDRLTGGNWIDHLDYKSYNGKEIKKHFYYNDSSIKDALNDISELYKDSKDGSLSNLYYSLLRLSFIGRISYDILDIKLTGIILNLIFYTISFYFLTKLLNLLFINNKFIIILTLLCISLIPSSIEFSRFLRPYQMQESFFIIFTYLIFNTMLNKKYSIKNFITITIITGIGYLTLYSSILFVLCISFVIFLYCLYTNYQNYKSMMILETRLNSMYSETFKDKRLIYFALSFFLSFFVSFILYNNFFNSIFSTTPNKARLAFNKPIDIFINLLDKEVFIGLLPLMVIIFLLYVFIEKLMALKIYQDDNSKYMLSVFLIIASLIFSVMSYIMGQYPRYVEPVFPLLFILVPTTLLLCNIIKLEIL